MTFTVLSHTADTGIEAEASSLPDLLAVMAKGMFRVMANADDARPTHEVSVEVSSSSREDLVVDALSELLYRSEVDDLHFTEFDMALAGRFAVLITAKGISVSDVEPDGAPIKAVTYHDVAVEETSSGWYGRVYFDV